MNEDLFSCLPRGGFLTWALRDVSAHCRDLALQLVGIWGVLGERAGLGEDGRETEMGGLGLFVSPVRGRVVSSML